LATGFKVLLTAESELLIATSVGTNKKAVRKMDSPFLIQVENPNVTSILRSGTFPFAWPWSLSPLGSRICISWAIVYYVRCWMASGNPVIQEIPHYMKLVLL
jgi:hypothetical protein